MSEKKTKELLRIIELLRDSEKSYSWDKKQTFESIIPLLIEKIYEVAEEIYNKNYVGLKKKLGDLLFQVIYISQIAKERKKFNFDDIVKSISDKIEYEYPHVFSNKKFNKTEGFDNLLEKSKKKKSKGLLNDISKNYPALIRANKIQKKVASVGFDYSDTIKAIDKVIEESNELKKEIINKKNHRIKEELGDLIFASLDVSRKLNLNPEIILSKANKKFIKRWEKIEKYLLEDKRELNDLNLKDFDFYWNKAKK